MHGKDEILKAVAEFYNVTPKDIMGPHRSKGLSLARHVAMYLCRLTIRHVSYPDVGRMFNRDHTSIMHAYNRIANKRASDAVFNEEVEHIMTQLPKPVIVPTVGIRDWETGT